MSKLIKEKTDRICEICKNPVYKKYKIIQGIAICTWDQTFTCCPDCEQQRYRKLSSCVEINGIFPDSTIWPHDRFYSRMIYRR